MTEAEVTQTQEWYSKGFGGIKKEEERIAASLRPGRVWIKKGTKRELIFVDDEPFTIREHNFYSNGSWKNWLTCAQTIYDDTVCCEKLGNKSSSWVGYFTAVDCSEWKDKQGNTHKYELQLFRAPRDTLKILESRREEHGTLVGAMFNVQRVGDKSPGCGDDFSLKKIVDLSKVFDLAQFRGKKLKDLIANANADEKEFKLFRSRFSCEPVDGKIPDQLFSFNYMELLRPRTPKEMKEILSGYKAPKSNESQTESEAPEGDDEVPF